LLKANTQLKKNTLHLQTMLLATSRIEGLDGFSLLSKIVSTPTVTLVNLQYYQLYCDAYVRSSEDQRC